MSGADKRPTADMLLVDARRRRLLAGRSTSGSVRFPTTEDDAEHPSRSDPSNVLVADEDAIIEEESGEHDLSASAIADHDRPQFQKGGLYCYRPLTTVTLAQLPWSGAIDHAVLHEAIVCAPFGAGTRAPNLVRCAAAPELGRAPRGEPSLLVRLGDDDVAALELALGSVSADIGGRLASAALLPESLRWLWRK